MALKRTRFRRFGNWIAGVSVVGLVAGPAYPTQAQSSSGAGAVRCMDSNDPIYVAAARVSIRGVVRACSNGVAYDVTPAPYQIRSDERLLVAWCRYTKQIPDALMRARMNTPYLLNPMRGDDITSATYTAYADYRWRDTRVALPFVPMKILDLGSQQGTPYYAYSGLRFLPSQVNAAYPLNASSVVVAMDGCMFSSPNALAALLAIPRKLDYIEITYYQEGEVGRPFRRAFLPIYQRAAVETEWSALTRSSTIFEPDRSGKIVAFFTALTIAALIYQFSQTATGQQLIREYQDCVRRRDPAVIC